MAVTLTPQVPSITCDPAGASSNCDLPETLQEILSQQETMKKKLSNEEALNIIVKAARSAIDDIVKASRQKQSKTLLPKDEALPY